ncbi:MAG: RNA polymerase sigma factor [Firmicutes bacterium]|nr:RNA polymerase sigma factor [Bacillota bacterium]
MKMNCKEDAEDLAQDIVLQILAAISAGKYIDNWNAFIWTVSNRTFYKRLRNKRETAYLLHPMDSGELVDDALLKSEERRLLLREISFLSKKYREAVILHYFEGKTCEEIAKIQGKSSGTVKWWLHDARKHIMEGMNTMREYGIKSINPGTLKISCTGSLGADNEPVSCGTWNIRALCRRRDKISGRKPANERNFR